MARVKFNRILNSDSSGQYENKDRKEFTHMNIDHLVHPESNC